MSHYETVVSRQTYIPTLISYRVLAMPNVAADAHGDSDSEDRAEISRSTRHLQRPVKTATG